MKFDFSVECSSSWIKLGNIVLHMRSMHCRTLLFQYLDSWISKNIRVMACTGFVRAKEENTLVYLSVSYGCCLEGFQNCLYFMICWTFSQNNSDQCRNEHLRSIDEVFNVCKFKLWKFWSLIDAFADLRAIWLNLKDSDALTSNT